VARPPRGSTDRELEPRDGGHRDAHRAARRVNPAGCGENIQPVHLFPVLMAIRSETNVGYEPDAARGGIRASSARAAKLVLVISFLFVIALPLAANLAGRDGADPDAEKRELAAFPRLDRSWQSIALFGTDFAHWFDDHFGFRASFVRWYGETRLFWLDVSPSA